MSDELFFNPTRRQVEARARTYWVDLLLDEAPVAIKDAAAAAAILANHARQHLDVVLPAADTPAGKFLARLRWLAEARPDLELPAVDESAIEQVLPEICYGLKSLDDVREADWLSWLQTRVGYDRLAEIDRLAPPEIELPSGNRHAIAYEAGKTPVLAVRIQEVFGLRETPRDRRRTRAALVATAWPQLSAAASDGGPRQLLGERLSGSEEGAAPPLSEALLARRPDRDAGHAIGIEARREVRG